MSLPKTRLVAMIIGLAAAPLAHAQVEDEAPKPAAARGWDTRFTAEIPFVLQRPQGSVYGLDGDALLPPYTLILSARQDPKQGTPAFSLSVNASFPRYSGIPAVGVTPALAFGVGGGFLELAIDLQDQQTVQNAKFQNSPFNTWTAAFMADLRFETSPYVEIGLEAKAVTFWDNSLGEIEGIETIIDHQGTYVLSPRVRLKLPLGLELTPRYDFYALGAAAIGSKTVAFGIKQQEVHRGSVSLKVRLGVFTVEGRFARVWNVRDITELAYQAPFYYRDNLLSPSVATLGVTWHL